MTITKHFYQHEDGTIAEFHPDELQTGVAHCLSYLTDANNNTAILFVETTPNQDIDAMGLATIESFMDSEMCSYLGPLVNQNTTVLEDIAALDVPGLTRTKSLQSFVQEMIQEDLEVESMDVDSPEDETFDIDDPEYIDIDLEAGNEYDEEDVDGEDFEEEEY